MKKLKQPLICLVILSLAFDAQAAEPNQLTDAEKQAGWRLLFDGQTTKGWRGYKQAAMPAKEGEEGILKKVGGERGGDIITEETFNDFDLSWQWRIGPGGNNGVKYLVTEERPSAPGPEYQMIDDKTNEDAARGGRHATASFYDVLPPTADLPLKPAGEWNLSRIRIQGNHVEHWLNGKKVLECELGSAEVKAAVAKSKFKNAEGFGTKINGHIMLTDHGDECWFRNIKIRDLSVVVRGAVRKPGKYSCSSGFTLTEAIGRAGGLNEFAHYKVQVLKAGGKRFVFDFRKVAKRTETDPALEPGDVVMVPERL